MKKNILTLVLLLLVGCSLTESRLVSVDDVLHHEGWRDGTFGPTGRRLFTERLDEGLGLRGQFSYIHYAKILDPIRLTLADGTKELAIQTHRTDWYPSHITTFAQVGSVKIVEQKFISDDDALVLVLELTNISQNTLTHRLNIDSGFATSTDGDYSLLVGKGDFCGVKAHAVIAGQGFGPAGDAASPSLYRIVKLEPGKTKRVVVAMAFDERIEDAHRKAKLWLLPPDVLAQHCRTYQQWFDENCPQFECDDPYISKAYWYRMFIIRHCLSRAEAGNLPHPYFFEGTHESHFPRLIAFSSPHIISETRWLRNPQYTFGQVRNHCLNADDGSAHFESAKIHQKRGDYNNWIVRSAWGAFWVHRDVDYLEEVVDSLAKDVRGTLAVYDKDGDMLPTPRNHGTTGMEFQPAFFYFTDYDNTKPDTPLERGDFVAYVYGNARAVAEAYGYLGRQEKAREFNAMADRIRQACLDKLWDEQDAFFYGVRESDDVKARTREVVGFYPFFSRLVPDEPQYMMSLKYLVDPAEFWTAFPPATVSKQCPAYTPTPEVWPAAGGRTHGCMWNGPAWPHATSVMLDVVAAAVQDYDQPYVDADHFWQMFDRYTHMHFTDDDLGRPLLREYNHGETGEATGCPDYFHSTYVDPLIRYVVGLQPSADGRLMIRPIPGALRRFSLRRLRYHGHDVDIVYNGEKADLQGALKGLTVWVDGRLAAHRRSLGELVVDLTGEKPES